MPPLGGRSRSAGFTYLEALIATIVVGTAIAAGLLLLGAGTQADAAALERLTGKSVAQELRELLETKTTEDAEDPVYGPEPGESSVAAFDDLDDFHGQAFSPPINSRLEVMTDLAGWTQEVLVESVEPLDPARVVAPLSSDLVRVRIVVRHGNTEVARLVTLRAHER